MKKILFLLIVVVVICGWFIFVPPTSDDSEKIFVIAKGESVNEISQHLRDQDFVKSKFIFESYVWLTGSQGKFQVGEHKIKQTMRVWEIVPVLTMALGPGERDIKIIEGWNNAEIADYLGRESVVSKDIFMEVVGNYKPETTNYEFLSDRPEGANLEGYLFPDTYRIYKEIPKEMRGDKDADIALSEHIVKKMLDNFDQKLSSKMMAEIKRQKKTVFEIVTMASVIEKEARGEDQAMVADIFWRRIKEGIALQSDATVNYATGKYETQPSLDDLKVASPYNTYKYRGLPAGPIGNPGVDAIKAAIYPKANNYWYFLHTKEGKTIYSRNFEEHKANKLKYLQ